jgi:hypothetical protein
MEVENIMNTKTNFCASALALFALAGTASTALGQTIHPEVEPNDNKTEALTNGAFVLNVGDGVSGTTQGSITSGGQIDSRDFFLLRTTAAPVGIYRHTLSLGVDAGVAPSTVNLRGVTQTAAAGFNFASDTAAQSAGTVGTQRQNSWYGFGREEQVYYYVQGTTSTTGNYTATLQTTPVQPIDLGVFEAGNIRITTDGYNPGVSGGNTAVWVYDSTFQPVPQFGNVADATVTPGTSPFSILDREFTAGTYYLAVANRNLHVPSQAAFDDRIRTTAGPDFQDIVFSSSTTRNLNVGFAIVDQWGPSTFSAFKTEFHEILWYRFEVGAVPASQRGGCCLADGTCVIATQASCDGQGGTFQGGGTNCSVSCPVVQGACCLPTVPTCRILTSAQCTTAGGTYSGDGTTCASAGCATLPITAVPIFTGEVTETFAALGGVPFAGGFNQCVLRTNGLRPFEDRASICTTGNNTNVTGGWGFFCSISYAGSSILGSTGGAINITFDEPVDRFGGYFGTNSPSPGGQRAWAEFYDASQNLIGAGEIQPFRNNCAWFWAGWQFSQPVTRVVLYHSYGNNGYLMIGALEADFAGGSSCYANCDGSTVEPILNVDDFTCFINEYASAQSLPYEQQVAHYSNCDGSTIAPVLNVDDFTCFINQYAQGCP